MASTDTSDKSSSAPEIRGARAVRSPLSLKLSAVIAGTVLAALLISGVQHYYKTRDLILRTIQVQLVSIANTLSASIDGDTYTQLTGKASIDTPEYKAIQTVLEKTFKSNEPLGFQYDNFYTFRRVSESNLEFAVMVSDRYVGNGYAVRAEMLPALNEGTSCFTGIYSDENGVWVSAYAPIKNRKQEVVGLVEVDVRNSLYLAVVDEELTALLMLTLISVAVALVMSVLVSRAITRPVRDLTTAALDFAKGNFDGRVPVTTQDEIGALASAFNTMAQEAKEKLTLQKYVSKSTLASVKRTNDTAMQPAGARVYKTYLYSDLRGVSGFVEKSTPEDAVRLINEYLSAQATLIAESGGDIDKFIGDEVLAVFEGKDMQARAALCALKLQSSVAALRLARNSDLQIAVGIHTGFALEGNFGSDDRLDFTVVGDAINIVARIARAAETGQVLVSKAVVLSLGGASASLAPVPAGDMTLKGKSNSIALYTIGEPARAAHFAS